MQEESELHWRKEEAIFNQLKGSGRDQYIQSTRNAHIMESQTLIRFIVQMNLFFITLLIYDIYDYTSRNYFIRFYGLIPALGFFIVPPVVFYVAKPIYNGRLDEKNHSQNHPNTNHSELSKEEQTVLVNALAPASSDQLITSKTTFDRNENSNAPLLTIENIDKLIITFNQLSFLAIVITLYIITMFLYIILWTKELDTTTIINGIAEKITFSTLDALTKWELTLVPILSILSTISLFHGITTASHLKELVQNGVVAYPIHGVFSDPDY